MLNISESLLIGYDSDEDTTILTVAKLEGSNYTYIHTFIGKEATEIYKKLKGD